MRWEMGVFRVKGVMKNVLQFMLIYYFILRINLLHKFTFELECNVIMEMTQ